MNALSNAARVLRQFPLANPSPCPGFASALETDRTPIQADYADNLLADLPDAVWRASQMGMSKAQVTPSGYPILDRELPNGGWPASMLIELLLSQNGIGELRLLAPVLANLTRNGKTVILLAPPHVPFAPALVELGLDLRHVLLIEADKPMDRIWAIEQALKSASFGALLCWLPQARSDHLRRLQLAAGGSDGLCFVFRPIVAQDQASPAPLRLVCHPSKEGGLSIDIIKRRGPVFGQSLVIPLAVPVALAKPLTQRTIAADPVRPPPGFAASPFVFSFDHVVDRTQSASVAT